ncbi:hypothetical protein D3C75_864710 [compost metagenome]
MDIVLRLLLVIIIDEGPVFQPVKDPRHMLYLGIAGLHIILQQLPIFTVRIITGIQLIADTIAGKERFKDTVNETGINVVPLDQAICAFIVFINYSLFSALLLHSISSPLSLRAACIWPQQQPGRRP